MQAGQQVCRFFQVLHCSISSTSFFIVGAKKAEKMLKVNGADRKLEVIRVQGNTLLF